MKDNIPKDLSAERGVLGSILLSNAVMDEVLDSSLKPDDFFHVPHSLIFEQMLKLYEQNKPIDFVTLNSALSLAQNLERSGGISTLTSIVEGTFSIGNAANYAKLITELSALRRMAEVCGEIKNEIQGDGAAIDDLPAFMNDAESRFFKVAELSRDRSYSPLSSILAGAIQQIEERASQKTDVVGLSTGFTEFDKITTGLHPGQIFIVAARPAMGKTSFVISMMLNAALAEGAVTALFSLEMTKEEIAFKFLTGVPTPRNGELRGNRVYDRHLVFAH